MQDSAKVPRESGADRPARRPLIDEELADQLLGKAQTEGIELLGPDGLLSQVTKAVLERALAEEMTGHLGYDKHDPAGRGSGNTRNGTTGKTVLTDIGAVDLAVPRDRNGSLEPQIVRKVQTRLEGFNERIIALYARPGNHESAGKRKHGKPRKGSQHLQHLQPLLVECAWPAARTSGRLKARYHRLVLRFGGYRNPAAKKRAIVTIAHALAVIIWHVLATGRPCTDLGPGFYTNRADPAKETQRLIAKPEALGHIVTLAPAA